MIKTAEENALYVDLNLYDDEQNFFSMTFTGEWEFNAVREYIAGVLTLTPYENGQAIPMVMRLVSDYAIDGVDFAGVGGFSFEGMGIGFGLQFASQTSDAEESIMAGKVIRPAELDEATFQQWFVEVLNGVVVELSNAMTALPESVMTLLRMSGM